MIPAVTEKVFVKSEPISNGLNKEVPSKKYTEEDLQKSVDAVLNKKMSQTQAAAMYNVPRKTIGRRLIKIQGSKKKKKKAKPIEPIAITTEKELEKHAHNIGIILENTNATPIRCWSDTGYGCSFCNQQYPNPADLKSHTLTHDPNTRKKYAMGKKMSSYLVKLDITNLQCIICNHPMEGLDNLIDHLVKIHGQIYNAVKNHILPFKFDGDTLKCVICSLTFSKFRVLQEHMNTHYKNYICDICGAGFVNRTILVNHCKGHKTGTYRCEHCPKIFNTLRKKRAHENSVHVYMNMGNKCGYCSEKFKSYYKKQEHLEVVHGISRVLRKCQACEKSFTTQAALRIHTKRDHLMERRYTCTECDRRFFSKKSLDDHMLKHTGSRKYQCDVCLKSYGRRYTLREHMRIHADDRRFKCEHCGQAFVQKCSWRGHMRSKHGDFV